MKTEHIGLFIPIIGIIIILYIIFIKKNKHMELQLIKEIKPDGDKFFKVI